MPRKIIATSPEHDLAGTGASARKSSREDIEADSTFDASITIVDRLKAPSQAKPGKSEHASNFDPGPSGFDWPSDECFGKKP
jgi:hypothetical protein